MIILTPPEVIGLVDRDVLSWCIAKHQRSSRCIVEGIVAKDGSILRVAFGNYWDLYLKNTSRQTK